jgi:diguanylate cyclase (GGDEF)-like protein
MTWSPVRFKTEPTPSSVARVQRVVSLVYLVLPLFALAAAADRPRVRSWPVLWATLALAAFFIASQRADLHRLRRVRFSGFRPGRAFAEATVSIAALSMAGIALGLHGGAFLLLPVIAFLVIALVGNTPMMIRGWLVLVAGLATETAIQLPAFDALWDTVLFAATAALLAAMTDRMMRGATDSSDRARELAELATDTSVLQDWPRDLIPLGRRLARVMDVSRYAVLTQLSSRPPIERVFSWPESDWPRWDELGELTRQSLEQMQLVESSALAAVPARAGTAAVIVVTPAVSKVGAPVDSTVLASVASLLAAGLVRTRIISGLVEAANTDELTGLANRRRLFDVLAHEMSRARRSHLPLTVSMIDLDHFKRYNDTFGHSAGDDLLQHFALQTTARVRAQDLLSRYGGEEFCLVLPETGIDGARTLVEGLRAAGVGEDRLGRRITFSAGLATWDGEESAEELVFRADASLYRAKAAGRDRIATAPMAS